MRERGGDRYKAVEEEEEEVVWVGVWWRWWSTHALSAGGKKRAKGRKKQ